MLLKGYRTLLANLVLALPVLVFIFSSPEVRAFIPQEYLPHYALLVSLLNLWLRTLTDTAMGKKE